jgi:protein involved in polysaccharide export with SLBB domain
LRYLQNFFLLRRGGLGGPRFAYLCADGRLTGLAGLDDESAVAAPVAANAVSQRMQAGDHINVTVYNEASLSGNYSIDSGGFVTIPLAGKLRAAGLSPPELADLLVKKFRSEYLNNPKVTVALI